MNAPKQSAARKPRLLSMVSASKLELPTEPLELALWGEVRLTRGVLVQEVRLWENRTHPMCDGWRSMGASEEDVGSFADGAIQEALRRVASFDEEVRSLRANPGKNYALQKLELLVRGYENRYLKTAHTAVVELCRGEKTSLAARTLLAIAVQRSTHGPAVIDIASTMVRLKNDPNELDIAALDQEAIAWCNLPAAEGHKKRFTTPTMRASYIVARATGWRPESAGDGLSPDQVIARVKKSEPL